MKFYYSALAATVSAAASTVTAPETANLSGSTAPVFFTTPAASAVGDSFTWAKGYGNGSGADSKIIEVDASADATLTFKAVYTGDLGADAAAQGKACPSTPIATGVPKGTYTSGTVADSKQTEAAKTHDAKVAIAWEMKPFKADDPKTAIVGGGTAATASTDAANAVSGTGATATCTSSVSYKVAKDSKNVVVTAMKTEGIKLGDGGAFGTVTATQSTTDGVKNAAGNEDAAGSTACAAAD